MTTPLTRPEHPSWPLTIHLLMQRMGAPSRANKWPDEGMTAREIDGVKVYVLPKPLTRLGRASPHRAMVICTCGRTIPYGRFHQHFHSTRHGDDLRRQA